MIHGMLHGGRIRETSQEQVPRAGWVRAAGLENLVKGKQSRKGSWDTKSRVDSRQQR